MRERSIEETRRFVRRVADRGGYVVNPDSEHTEHLIDGLNRNVNRLGYYACPCRDAAGDRTADRDICCPCVYNEPDQAEYGHCFCALFLSREFAESGKTPTQIPERRPPEKFT